MNDVLLKRNLPHVVTVYGSKTEELFVGPINPRDVIMGMAELNKNKICLLDISVGNSKEGTTKIDSSVLENGSIEGDTPPKHVDFLPEGSEYIPYKSDSWALGEFLVRNVYHPEGKSIPKRFMKSQKLLNTFIDSIGGDETLKKILVLDPNGREYTWNLIKEESGCNIQ